MATVTSKIVDLKFHKGHIGKLYLRMRGWSPSISLEDILILDDIRIPNLDIMLERIGEIKISFYDYTYELAVQDDVALSRSLDGLAAYLKKTSFPKLYSKISKYLDDEIDISFYRFKFVIPGTDHDNTRSYELRPLSLKVGLCNIQVRSETAGAEEIKVHEINASMEITISRMGMNRQMESYSEQEDNTEVEENKTVTINNDENNKESIKIAFNITNDGNINIKASNIPLDLLDSDGGQEFSWNKINGIINSELSANLSEDWLLHKANGKITLNDGTIYMPNSWQDRLDLKSFNLQMTYNAIPPTSEAKLKLDALAECNDLRFKASYQENKDSAMTINNKSSANNGGVSKTNLDGIVLSLSNNLSIAEVLRYWPNNKASHVKQWLMEHLHEGITHDTEAIFYIGAKSKQSHDADHLNRDEVIQLKVESNAPKEQNEKLFITNVLKSLSNITIEDTDFSTQIDNAKLDYMSHGRDEPEAKSNAIDKLKVQSKVYGFPAIFPQVLIHSSLSELTVFAKTASVYNTQLNDIKAFINIDKGDEIVLSLNIDDEITPVAQCLVAHTNQQSHGNNAADCDLKTEELQPLSFYLDALTAHKVKAKTKASAEIIIPLTESLSVAKMNITAHGTITGEAEGLKGDVSFSISDMKIKFITYLQKDNNILKLNGTKRLSDDYLLFNGSAIIPKYWIDEASIDGKWRDSGECLLHVNLTKNKIVLPKLNIVKEPGEQAEIVINTSTSASHPQSITINSYKIDMPSFASDGRAEIDQNGLLYLKSWMTRMWDGKFEINYKRGEEGSLDNLEIEGDSLDLSKSDLTKLLTKSKDDNSLTSISIKADVTKIILHDDIIIFAPKFTATYIDGNCSYLLFDGLLGNAQNNPTPRDDAITLDTTSYKGYVTMFYSYPTFSLVTNAAGILSKGLGVSNIISGGMLEIKGEMNANRKFSGLALMDRFRLTNSPVVAAILRLSAISSSFMNLARIFDNRGIDFDNSGCDVTYHDGNIVLTKCLAMGSTLLLKGGGTIGDNTAYFSGVITPLHFFNTVLLLIKKVLPKLGEFLLEGKGDRSNFEIITKDGNTKIKTNPFSVFLPGFLGSFFEGKTAKQDEE